MAAGWRKLGYRGADTALAVPFHQSAMADWSWVNMPDTLTWLYGSSRHVCKLDLTYYSEARLSVNVVLAGTSGSILLLKYKATTYSTTVGDYSDIGTSAVSVVLTSAGVISSAWVPLAAGAIADVFVGIAGSGGNGADDPKIGSVVAQFR